MSTVARVEDRPVPWGGDRHAIAFDDARTPRGRRRASSALGSGSSSRSSDASPIAEPVLEQRRRPALVAEEPGRADEDHERADDAGGDDATLVRLGHPRPGRRAGRGSPRSDGGGTAGAGPAGTTCRRRPSHHPGPCCWSLMAAHRAPYDARRAHPRRLLRLRRGDPVQPVRRLQRASRRPRGLPVDFIRTINATDPDTNAWARFERSEVSFDEFCDLFEAECRAQGRRWPRGS